MSWEDDVNKAGIPHCEEKDCNMQIVKGTVGMEKGYVLVKGSKCKRIETLPKTLLIALVNKLKSLKGF